MNLREYQVAVEPKVHGTWSLHRAAEALGFKLDIFTLLSSISRVVGNRGQANHAAANAFLDAFAAWRRPACGQDTCAISLSVADNDRLRGQFDDARVFRNYQRQRAAQDRA